MLGRRIVAAIAYIMWLVSLIMYNLALWGPSPLSGIDGTYVMRLSDSRVTLDVGYFGVCANVNSSSLEDDDGQFHCVNNLDFSLDDDDLLDKFVDDANIDNGSTALAQMLHFAGSFRTNSIPQGDAIAAMVLLLIGGLITPVPVFFNSEHRKKICSFLLGVCALLLGFGFMAGGGAFFTTWRLQNLFKQFEGEGDGPLADAFDRITFKTGSRLWGFILAAIVTNGIFVVFITWGAFLQAYPSKSKVTDSMKKTKMSTTRMGPSSLGPSKPKASKFSRKGQRNGWMRG